MFQPAVFVTGTLYFWLKPFTQLETALSLGCRPKHSCEAKKIPIYGICPLFIDIQLHVKVLGLVFVHWCSYWIIEEDIIDWRSFDETK